MHKPVTQKALFKDDSVCEKGKSYLYLPLHLPELQAPGFLVLPFLLKSKNKALR